MTARPAVPEQDSSQSQVFSFPAEDAREPFPGQLMPRNVSLCPCPLAPAKDEGGEDEEDFLGSLRRGPRSRGAQTTEPSRKRSRT